jgi:hypothetical protein
MDATITGPRLRPAAPSKPVSAAPGAAAGARVWDGPGAEAAAPRGVGERPVMWVAAAQDEGSTAGE